jgi:hypothetical protein
MTEKNTGLQRWLENLSQISPTESQKTRIKPRRARDKDRKRPSRNSRNICGNMSKEKTEDYIKHSKRKREL